MTAHSSHRRRRHDLSDEVRYYAFLTFLVACFIGGGGSRGDVMSLLYVRPIAILCLAVILAMPGKIDLAAVRWPFWLLVGFAGLMAVQLVPLPPEIWTALPGRRIVVEGAGLLDVAQPWRPISMTPDATLNSLAACVVPFAALVGFAALTHDHRKRLLGVLIVFVGISGILAILQISGSPGGIFYLYRITNDEAAVGLFANRNHQAILLAMALPMLALWASRVRGDPQGRALKQWSAFAAAATALLLVLVTGSRAGLILGAVAAAWAIYYFLEAGRAGKAGPRHVRSTVIALVCTGVLASALAFISYSRAISLQRILGQDLGQEQRLRYFPELLDMVRDYFPIGSGFGSFDPLFRAREPFEYLSTRYFNHAHNDLIELLITAGGAGLLLLLGFLFWWGRESLAAFRGWRDYPILGSVLILLLLLASLVDYPLRTPIMAALLAIACGWLASARQSGKA